MPLASPRPAQLDPRVAERPAGAARLGRWELCQLVGEGDFSRVYRARPANARGPAADYAIKIARADRRDHAECAALLAREAAVAAQVAHPHLTAVLATHCEAAPHYLVMPYLRGVTLAVRLAAGQRFALPVTLAIARQVAQALTALAAAGYRHGDVKPANLMLSPDGHVTLLDLGFAAHREEDPALAARLWLGTPEYAAPERFTSRIAIDPASDVYSLGIVLYRLLSGRMPFTAGTLEALAGAHVHETPLDLKTLVPGLPEEVVGLVMRMLAKEPLRRPTAEELSELLARCEIDLFDLR